MPQIQAAADLVRSRFGSIDYDLAVILGSGFDAASSGEVLGELPFGDLPGVPAAPVPGHSGRLLCLRVRDRRVLAFAGRFHCYQGLSARQAAFPVRLAKALAVDRLLITSAVGGISREMTPGTFVLLRDHLNLLGDNPLAGEVPPRFVDLSRLYRQDVFDCLAAVAGPAGINLQRGVLAALPGPSYETPAEIEMLRRLGADVVSMSMVPEAIMAAACGLQVVGLALVTNLAAGLTAASLDHREVLAAGASASGPFGQLFEALLENWCSFR
ncbi:purine-nucleoside phosphorylase [Geothermobacter hydrogeniphilus]|uniref:Purine nucleoside phosphorylase n=1 Tax=Geothermobacter hydrogeniphilus TaxID=1969733 RepID=A0A1X0Y382_9BACT|nr:purine-nucleoside phosphorylase [Geothermobacter hydrogeniphilus]ORJ59589.1 purine-nucleoside phosphorylase [Geothermobacter hydrogeniphilus]